MDGYNCEISRHVQGLVTNSQSLPGTLISRFITCTWDTNATTELSLQLQLNNGKVHNSDHHNNNNYNVVSENTAKTDWYASNIQSQWAANPTCAKIPLSCATQQAYANGGYLLNTATRNKTDSVLSVSTSVSSVTEHKVLSNVRQFIDGMKRYLLNEPDTQLMYAIQRERVKVS